MSYFKQPALLMFLGVPGSGKSHFARLVADEMNAVRFRFARQMQELIHE